MVPPYVGAAPTGVVALAGDSPGRGAALATSQRAVAPYGLAAGAAYANKRRPSRHQPCRERSCMLATAPARGFGRGRPPPCKRPWPQLA
ncbi:hypothetical protein BHM03_00049457 [Ensete ventricosum]|nr:hypothetical protein BHM03_00049457 [Ensete ventricosum]